MSLFFLEFQVFQISWNWWYKYLLDFPFFIMDSNPFEGIMSTNPSRRNTGNKRARTASMEVVSSPISQTVPYYH